MAELGALSLRIETVGDKQALSSLDAIDRKAQQTAGSNVKLTAAQKALNREIAESAQIFALQARTADLSDKQQVAGLRQVATAQLQYMQRVGASEKQLLQFAATAQAFEQRVAGATTNAAAGVQVFGREITNAHGKVSAFGKSGLNAFNALAFGISQMAATGTVSFRSLATSMTSVLAFFGTGGAIAAAVTATGLVLVDFFTRQKKEIAELDALLKKLDSDATARRERDLPVTVAEEELAAARKGVAALRIEMAALVALRNLPKPTQERDVTDRQINAVAQRRLALERDITEALRKLNDAQAKSRTTLEGVKVTAESVATTERKRVEALRDLVTALLAADKANLTTATDLGRIATAEKGLNELLNRTTTSYADRIKILQELAGLEAARLRLTQQQALVEKDLGKPAVGLTPGVGAVPPTGIAVPPVSVTFDPLKALKEDLARLAVGPGTGNTLRAAAQHALDQIAAQMEPLTFKQQVELDLQLNAAQAVDEAFASSLSNVASVVTEALGAAFSGGNVKDVILKGIGGIFQQMGAALISYGLIMQGLLPALLNPFTSGPAALAAGAALVALGSALKGAATGKGGGAGAGAGGYGGSSGGGLDTIRSFVTGSDRLSALTAAPKGLRDTIGDLRRSTFGADAIGALSPRTSLGSLTTATAPANPLSGLRFVVMNEPSGQREVAFVVNTYNRDRGGR